MARERPRERRRRPAAEARRRILEAAEKHLVERGPEGVRVQSLARELGITDAAIHYHFGSREALLTALLEFGGRELRAALEAAVGPSLSEELDLPAFLSAATSIFRDRGYSRLALWLSASGWRSRGSGLFDDLVGGIRAARPGRSLEEARHLGATIALLLMAEPIFGEAARRSVSLPAGPEAGRRFERFLARNLTSWVEGEVPG